MPDRARWSWACNPRRYDAGMSPHLLTASLFLFAYLLGSASGSLLLGRLRGVDIRQHGSGNAGGTNAFRTLANGGRWTPLRVTPANAAVPSAYTYGPMCVLPPNAARSVG